MGLDFEKEEYRFLGELGLGEHNLGCYVAGKWKANGPSVTSFNPSNNTKIATVVEGSLEDYEEGLAASDAAKEQWMLTPAPRRGEIVRQIGDVLRANLAQLGKLVSLEMGKILAEGVGEVQEFIDMCDFAVGLSRQINGSVIPSERKYATLRVRMQMAMLERFAVKIRWVRESLHPIFWKNLSCAWPKVHHSCEALSTFLQKIRLLPMAVNVEATYVMCSLSDYEQSCNL